jgi:NAD(P)-dependent dehydrogenase (short-subunit alcohol dehydrogenase family)
MDDCVIVTGGASGIGLECARRLLAEGSRVGISDKSISPELAGLVDSSGGRAAAVTGDVSRPEAVERNYLDIVDRLGRPSALVCAAGVMSGKTLIDTPIELWRQTFAVNVEGSVLWMQAVLPDMIQNHRGSVVLFSSQLTRSGGRNNAAYISAKAALIGLARTSALELAPYNVRVNAIVPGAVDTPMLRDGSLRFDDPEGALARSRARHPLGRFGTSGEIAEGVLFLLSERSSFMTGAELVIDGGWSIG